MVRDTAINTSTDIEPLEEWAPEEYLWSSVLERMLTDYLFPDLIMKEVLQKEYNVADLKHAIFNDDDTMGTAYWIAREIFGGDFRSKLEGIRRRVKLAKAHLVITLVKKDTSCDLE